MTSRQNGFTLIEISIVLVIIGLLLGGVLKGQELIQNAKVKALVNDFKQIGTMIYAYQDRFRALPGDQTQTQLDSGFGTSVATTCTQTTTGSCQTGNGRLNGGWNDANANSETFVAWQHLRLANLASGTVNLSDSGFLPRNAEGGLIGLESGISSNGSLTPFIGGMRGNIFVCSGNISGRQARQIDLTMDDGNTASGNVQIALSSATRGDAPVAAGNIEEAQTYIVCASL